MVTSHGREDNNGGSKPTKLQLDQAGLESYTMEDGSKRPDNKCSGKTFHSMTAKSTPVQKSILEPIVGRPLVEIGLQQGPSTMQVFKGKEQQRIIHKNQVDTPTIINQFNKPVSTNQMKFARVEKC